MQIAGKGMTREAIFEQLAEFRKNDIKWQEGRAYGYIFDPGKAVMEVGKAAYNMFLSENGLDFTAFQSLLRLERELAAFGARHLRGDGQVVGNFTSGGTESIILAVKAARDGYREKCPEIKAPEMILPTSAHAAFHKAAHYLGVKVLTVSVDPQTFKADVSRVMEAITDNTIMIVGSAPSSTMPCRAANPAAPWPRPGRCSIIWVTTDTWKSPARNWRPLRKSSTASAGSTVCGCSPARTCL